MFSHSLVVISDEKAEIIVVGTIYKVLPQN